MKPSSSTNPIPIFHISPRLRAPSLVHNTVRTRLLSSTDYNVHVLPERTTVIVIFKNFGSQVYTKNDVKKHYYIPHLKSLSYIPDNAIPKDILKGVSFVPIVAVDARKSSVH